jgi:hypothetical protein
VGALHRGNATLICRSLAGPALSSLFISGLLDDILHCASEAQSRVFVASWSRCNDYEAE